MLPHLNTPTKLGREPEVVGLRGRTMQDFRCGLYRAYRGLMQTTGAEASILKSTVMLNPV